MTDNPLLQFQPVSNVQWKHRDELTANDYNPNTVFGPELDLLRVSILEDGWVVPIVINERNEIVDGEHRWTLSGEPAIYALTDGYVPVVVLPQGTDEIHRRLSTVRYNRARGVHGVTPMAEIVGFMLVEGVEPRTIARRLGMDMEEVRRLADKGNMVERGAAGVDGFSQAWVPGEKTIVYADDD